jgi:signal transduction histidine kinase
LEEENQLIFKNLQRQVEITLLFLSLKAEYKSLLSKVSHDLASPLSYLKFSSEILESQIGSNSQEDLIETGRVISSSTTKLSEEANQLVTEGKSTLHLTELPKTSLIELLSSSLYLLKLDEKSINLKGNLTAKVVNFPELYQYLLFSLINELSKIEFQLKSIKVMPCRKDLKITLSGDLSQPLDDSNLDTIMNELKQQPLVHSVLEVLQADISSYTNTLKQLSVEVVLSKAMS